MAKNRCNNETRGEEPLVESSGSTKVDPLQVMNDISEDIDNGETREQLRKAIEWWACSHETMARITQQQRQEIDILRMTMNSKDLALADEILGK